MTMVITRTIAAGEFKAKCLALIDDVASSGRPIVITKRGRPVARLLPLEGDEPRSLIGSVTFLSDVIEPIDVEWEADQ